MSRHLRRILLLPWILILVAIAPAHGGAATDPIGRWPLSPQPQVLTTFDPPESEFGAGHRGIDLAGSGGQAVLSSLPGQVSFAGVIAGRGVVVVTHGGTRTTYEPVSAGVSVGATVTAGQPLGTLQLIGSHCFPRACLHWGWLRGDVYLDPLALVGGVRRVRLLPLTGAVGSGPGMRLLVGPSQPIRRDVRVELGRGQGGVSQQLLHRAQVGSPF